MGERKSVTEDDLSNEAALIGWDDGSAIYQLGRLHKRIVAERDQLTEALRGLVEALPRCDHGGCQRRQTAMNFNRTVRNGWCDEHARPMARQQPWAAAIRKAQEALDGTSETVG